MVRNPMGVTGTKGWAAAGNCWVLHWCPVPKSSSHLEGSDTAWVWRKAGPPLPRASSGGPFALLFLPVGSKGGHRSRAGPPGSSRLGLWISKAQVLGHGKITRGRVAGARSLGEEGWRELRRGSSVPWRWDVPPSRGSGCALGSRSLLLRVLGWLWTSPCIL